MNHPSEQSLENTTRVWEIIDAFPPLKTRVPRFQRPPNISGGRDSYNWLVNTWLPSQADFDVLAELAILLDFNMSAVVCALMGRERFQKFLDDQINVKEIK